MSAAAGVMAAGLAVAVAAPAQATTVYNVTSNWWQAYAGLTSTGGEGVFQAEAFLGYDHAFGPRSQYNTQAEVNGFNFTHNAYIWRDGAIWKRAQN